MSTETLTPVPTSYLELIERHPLRPIRSDAELHRAIAVMNSLLVVAEPTGDQGDYLEVLGDTIANYETEAHPVEPLSHAEMLRALLEERGVTQAELAAATNVPESTISSILSGRRGISKTNVAAFARFFHVTPFVFLGE